MTHPLPLPLGEGWGGGLRRVRRDAGEMPALRFPISTFPQGGGPHCHQS